MARYEAVNPIQPELLLHNIERRGVNPHFALQTSVHPLALLVGNVMARYNVAMRSQGYKDYSMVTYPAEMNRLMGKLVYYPLEKVLEVREETLPFQDISKRSYPIWQQRLPEVDGQGQKRDIRIPSSGSLEAQLALLAGTGLAREVTPRQFELPEAGHTFLLTQPDEVFRRLGTNPKILYDVLWGQSNPMEGEYPKGFLRRLALLLVIAEAAPAKDSPLHLKDILQSLGLGNDKLAQITEDVKRLHGTILTYEGKTQKEMTPEYDVPTALLEHPEQAEEILPYVKYYGSSTGAARRIQEAIVSLAKEGTRSFTIDTVAALVNEMRAKQPDAQEREIDHERVETVLRQWRQQGYLTGKHIDGRKQAEIYLTGEQAAWLQEYVEILKGPRESPRRGLRLLNKPEKFSSTLAFLESAMGASRGRAVETAVGYDAVVGGMIAQLGRDRANIQVIARETGFDRQAVERSLARLKDMNIALEESTPTTGKYYSVSFPGLMDAVPVYPELNDMALRVASGMRISERQTFVQEAENLLILVEAGLQSVGVESHVTGVAEELLKIYREQGVFGKDPLMTRRLLRLALKVGVAITTKGELLAIGNEEIRDLVTPNAGVAEMFNTQPSTNPLYLVMRRSTTRRPNGTNTEMVVVTRKPEETRSSVNELRQGLQALIYKAEHGE